MRYRATNQLTSSPLRPLPKKRQTWRADINSIMTFRSHFLHHLTTTVGPRNNSPAFKGSPSTFALIAPSLHLHHHFCLIPCHSTKSDRRYQQPLFNRLFQHFRSTRFAPSRSSAWLASPGVMCAILHTAVFPLYLGGIQNHQKVETSLTVPMSLTGNTL